MVPKFVKRSASLYRRTKFCCSPRYRMFIKDRDRKKIIYLSETDHTNLGDHAILYAQHRLLDGEIPNLLKYSFTRRECLFAFEQIQKGICKQDIILIPGGGWIGTLWKVSGELFLSFLETFKDNRIIVFPQTIYFENTTYGAAQKKRFYDAVKNCKDILLYVRDTNSYRFLQNQMPEQNSKIQYRLAPDMVLSLQPGIQMPKKEYILFVMRQDLEKVTDEGQIEQLKKRITDSGMEIRYGDTHTSKAVAPQNRETALHKKWEEFAKARLVITDRLHGMLFAVINGTPCIALDNLSNKVKGVYDEWLTDNPGVCFLNAETLSDDALYKCVERLLAASSHPYQKEVYASYFKNMTDAAIRPKEVSNGKG